SSIYDCVDIAHERDSLTDRNFAESIRRVSAILPSWPRRVSSSATATGCLTCSGDSMNPSVGVFSSAIAVLVAPGGGCFNGRLRPPPYPPPHRSQAVAGGGERRERTSQGERVCGCE